MKCVRILLIAIVGVLGLDVEGMQPQASVQTCFDLPADTPGLMRDKQTKPVCGSNKDCVHIIVPRTNADYAKDRGIVESMAVDGNIYFPADGTQPTTEEAVEYSCANVKNDAITDWYMKMFGVIDKNGDNSVSDDDYVKVDGHRIITFDSNVVQKETALRSFEKMFRILAADPVGRILLYRLLIEIFRIDSEKKTGCTEKAWQMSGNEDKRNVLRHILVKYADYVWLFNWGDSTLSFNDQEYSKYAVKIYNNNDTFVTRYGTTPMVVYLFHEMLHWFHNIQYYGRYNRFC